MKKKLLAVMIAVAAVVGLASPCLATDPPDDTPTVVSKKVYRNLLETGDRLFLVYVNIPYAVTPDDPVTETFIWQLIDSDGVTVLGSTVGYAFQENGYGYNVYSLYFDAAAALAWAPALPYTLRLIGNPIQFASPPSYDFTVNAGDYTSLSTSADVKAELASDILTIAHDLELQWGLTTYGLVVDDDMGQYLDLSGQTVFRGAIYGIQSLAPALFPLAVRNIDMTDRTWTDAYEGTLKNQYNGTWIATARAAGAALFGVDYDLTTIIVLLVLLAGVFFGELAVSHNVWSALVDDAFILVIAARLGFYDLGILGLICALCVIYISVGMKRQFFS